jgi:hypothetical protein
MRRRLTPGIILGVTLGLAVGVGAYTFVYARGYSYMTDNAEACVNCHVMQEQFSGWVKSSHRAVQRLGEIKSSSCCSLQRLSHATGPNRKIFYQGAKWVLAFLLLYDWLVRRQHPDHTKRSRGN